MHSRCSGLPELLHFEISTLFPRAMRIWQPVVRCLSFASDLFFSCVRHRRGGGVAGSLDSHMTCHQIVLRDWVASYRVIVWTYIWCLRQVASETTTTTTTTTITNTQHTTHNTGFKHNSFSRCEQFVLVILFSRNCDEPHSWSRT